MRLKKKHRKLDLKQTLVQLFFFFITIWRTFVGMYLSWLEHRTVTPLTQVRFPGAARNFSPRLNFQCRLSYVCPYTPVCNRMHLHLCARLRSCSSCQSAVNYGHTKTPSMHPRLGGTTLSQLAFPGEATRISNGEIPLGQYSCKKIFSSLVCGEINE